MWLWPPFLFAWYTVNGSLATSGVTQQISTINSAQLESKTIVASYAGTEDAQDHEGEVRKVELTAGAVREADEYSVAQAIGTTYVFNGTKVVEATNQSTLTKSERVAVTFAVSDLQSYIGNKYEIRINATAQLRIATSTNAASDSAWTKNNYVGQYSAATTYDADAKEFTGGTEVLIGTITVTAANAVSYDSVVDINSTAADEALYFYVSVSPVDDDGSAEGDVGAAHGLIGISSVTLNNN